MLIFVLCHTKKKKMKTVTTFLYVQNNQLESTILETVKNFKGIEILECVSDKYAFIERVGRQKPDIMFMEFNDQIDQQLELYEMISKPLFPIAICHDESQITRLLDKGFFEVLPSNTTKEQIINKLFKAYRFSKDVLERFNASLIVASPRIEYSKKSLVVSNQKDTIYLRYKSTRIKVVIEEIVYIQSIKELIVVVLESGRKIFHQGSLKKLLEIIPGTKIVRISNTMAINHQKVERLQKQQVLIGDNNFKVSRLYISKLKETLKIKQIS